MANNGVMTLSRKGIITGVAERIQRLYAYYITTNSSQGRGQFTNAPSLQGTIQAYGHSSKLLPQYVQDDLNAIFNPHFDAVEATVTINETSSFDNSHRMTIVMDVVVYVGSTPYSMGQQINSINGVLQDIFNAVNGTTSLSST